MSSNPADFSRQHFKSPDIVDDDWLAWFREEFSPTLTRIETNPAPGAPFALNGVTRILPDIAVYRGSSSPSHNRNMAQLAVDDDPSIVMALSGAASMHVADNEVALTPGSAIVIQNDLPTTLIQHTTCSFLFVRLRRRLLAPLIDDVSSLRNLPPVANQQALRLLVGYLSALDGESTIAAPETQHMVTTHVHELAALAIGATKEAENFSESRGKRAGRLAAIKADILSNLASPRLSVAAVAARQGVTPRYVQMLFETEGLSFSEFVIAQRLARAHRMLSDPRFSIRPIHDIALQVGFGDLSYFNRTFRRRYGMTPSDARKAAR